MLAHNALCYLIRKSELELLSDSNLSKLKQILLKMEKGKCNLI